MCTLVILRRPDCDWPLVIAANRDEMVDRPWLPPAAHWREREGVIGGLDQLAGGTWMGINRHGVVAVMLNRLGSLGVMKDKRSRGELVLEALDHINADDAANALLDIKPESYRPFNLVLGDFDSLFWLRHDGERVTVQSIGQGVSMLTARELNDRTCPRIQVNLERFRTAPPPKLPKKGNRQDWHHWQQILASQIPLPPVEESLTDSDQENPSVNIEPLNGYGTVSSTCFALPSRNQAFGDDRVKPQFLFANGAPHLATFKRVELGW